MRYDSRNLFRVLMGAALGALVCLTAQVAFAQDGAPQKPFQLGVEEKHKMEGPSYPAYPSYPQPVMVQPPVQKPPSRPLQSSVQQNQQRVQQPQPAPVRRPAPLQAGVQATKVLPPQFLGTWMVMGQRGKVEAAPQYQQGIDGIFTMNNQQMWKISGGPGGYQLSSNTGVSTGLMVDGVQGNTAYLRYQHQIKNTMAQEAIVMQLSPDGNGFEGLERISIVKQGEPLPRAKVTYNLMGRRH